MGTTRFVNIAQGQTHSGAPTFLEPVTLEHGTTDIIAPAGEDLSVRLGDNAGANVFELLDLAGTRRWAVDSDGVVIAGGGTHFADDAFATFGNTSASPDVRLGWNTTQTVDGLFLGLSDAQNTFIIAENGDRTFDFAHGAQTNPTVFIHSATQSTTQWISLSHNQTDAVVNVGTGNLNLTSGVNFTKGSQDYLFTDFSASLGIQGQSAATGMGVGLFSNDGDGTDTVQLNIFGVGTPSSFTNRERLIVEWNSSSSEYEIFTEANGTGTVRGLTLYTQGNADQLALNTNGTVSFSTSVVTPEVTTSGAVDLVLSTNDGTASAELRIQDGLAGSIVATLTAGGAFTLNGGGMNGTIDNAENFSLLSFTNNDVTNNTNLAEFNDTTTGNTLNIVKNVAAGSSISTNRTIAGSATEIEESNFNLTISSGTQSNKAQGINSKVEFTGSSAQTGALTAGGGLRGGGLNSVWSSTGTADAIIGGFLSAEVGSVVNGLIADMYGATTLYGHSGTGTVTTGRGLLSGALVADAGTSTTVNLIETIFLDGSGATHTIGTMRGVYVPAMSYATGTGTAGIDVGAITGSSGFNYAIRTSTGPILAGDAIWFTQTDGNERIDSAADGYLDYTATTAHRFNQAVANTDVRLEFIATSNSGLLEWMEDEDYFRVGDSVLFNSGTVQTASGVDINIGASASLQFNTTSTEYDIVMNEDDDLDIGVARQTTAATDGSNTRLFSGSAVSGGTNRQAGGLVLSTGISTGNANASISFQTSTPGVSGTADQSVSTKLVLDGNGVLRGATDGVTVLGSSTIGFGGLHLNTATSISWEGGAGTITYTAATDIMALSGAANYTFDGQVNSSRAVAAGGDDLYGFRGLIDAQSGTLTGIGGAVSSQMQFSGASISSNDLASGDAPSANFAEAYFNSTGTAAALFANYARGIIGAVTHGGITDFHVQRAWYENNGTGGVTTNATGFSVKMESPGAATETNVRGLHVEAFGIGGTLNIGLDIEAISGTGAASIRQASGAVMNWAAGDVTLTHASNTMTWAGATSGYVFNDGIVNASSASVRLKRSVADVSTPPTDAELDATFGDPTTVGSGFIGVLDDNDAGTACYLVWTTGTAAEWFYALGTKAA